MDCCLKRMTNALKSEWNAMKRGAPGSRFKDRYAAAKKARQTAGWTQHIFRVVRLLIAAASLAIGVVLMFIPGPAILFYFIAGGLLASESKLVARFLDWTELKLRALWKWGQRHWKKMPLVAKVAVTALVVCLGAGAAFGMYRLMAG